MREGGRQRGVGRQRGSGRQRGAGRQRGSGRQRAAGRQRGAARRPLLQAGFALVLLVGAWLCFSRVWLWLTHRLPRRGQSDMAGYLGFGAFLVLAALWLLWDAARRRPTPR